MSDVIRHKRSDVGGKLPTSDDLVLGEIAVNTEDARMFILRNNGSVAEFNNINNIDGGHAASVYLPIQRIDGGNADG